MARDPYPAAKQAVHGEGLSDLHQRGLVRSSGEGRSLGQPTGPLPTRTAGLRGDRRTHGWARDRGGAARILRGFAPGVARWSREDQEKEEG
jgi:hypothetical protein